MFNIISVEQAKEIADFAKQNKENMAIAISKYPALLGTGLLDINECYDFSIVSLCSRFPDMVQFVESRNYPKGRLRDKWRSLLNNHRSQFKSISLIGT